MMDLQNRFQAEKRAVASLLKATLSPGESTELAMTLEMELATQIEYDHRDVSLRDLKSLWDTIPSISELLSSAEPQSIAQLGNSTYAFRLMALGHVSKRVHCNSSSYPRFAEIIDQLGLGITEIESYAQDLLK